MAPIRKLVLKSEKKRENQTEMTKNDSNAISAISSGSTNDSLHGPLFRESNHIDSDKDDSSSDSDSLFASLPRETPKSIKDNPNIQISERTRRMREEKEKDEIQQKQLSAELRRRNSRSLSHKYSSTKVDEESKSLYSSIAEEDSNHFESKVKASTVDDSSSSKERDQRLRNAIDKHQKNRIVSGLDGECMLMLLLFVVLTLILSFCYTSSKNNPRLTLSYCSHNVKLCASLIAREVRARF